MGENSGKIVKWTAKDGTERRGLVRTKDQTHAYTSHGRVFIWCLDANNVQNRNHRIFRLTYTE